MIAPTKKPRQLRTCRRCAHTSAEHEPKRGACIACRKVFPLTEKGESWCTRFHPYKEPTHSGYHDRGRR